jgi:DNA modification methylase
VSGFRLIVGDCIEKMRGLEPESVQCVVTSPPYWGLRDYGIEGQLGLEQTPEQYVERMVEVFREVRRVLRDDGTVWLNLGDSYSTIPSGQQGKPSATFHGGRADPWTATARRDRRGGLKPKDLVGIPWRVAFALQADGWWLRSDIIWAKPNPMPESVTDRPTKAHEYVFLLTKSARYYYDADAVREPVSLLSVEVHSRYKQGGSALGPKAGIARGDSGSGIRNGKDRDLEAGRNLRSVWNIATESFPEAHFATFPKKLVTPCIKAGTSEKGCCQQCGRPWERVRSEVVTGERHVSPKDAAGHEARGATSFSSSRLHSQYFDYDRQTHGWEPGCAQHTLEQEECIAVPCTVLDPFCGSGTVGVVALREGRSFIGIDLNPTYVEMARRRIYNDGPLFNIAADNVEGRQAVTAQAGGKPPSPSTLIHSSGEKAAKQ